MACVWMIPSPSFMQISLNSWGSESDPRLNKRRVNTGALVVTNEVSGSLNFKILPVLIKLRGKKKLKIMSVSDPSYCLIWSYFTIFLLDFNFFFHFYKIPLFQLNAVVLPPLSFGHMRSPLPSPLPCRKLKF